MENPPDSLDSPVLIPESEHAVEEVDAPNIGVPKNEENLPPQLSEAANVSDEESSSSSNVKTVDEGTQPSTEESTTSTNVSDVSNDKDVESNSNEFEKALEILKEFTKLRETTPKKPGFSSFDDDTFPGEPERKLSNSSASDMTNDETAPPPPPLPPSNEDEVQEDKTPTLDCVDKEDPPVDVSCSTDVEMQVQPEGEEEEKQEKEPDEEKPVSEEEEKENIEEVTSIPDVEMVETTNTPEEESSSPGHDEVETPPVPSIIPTEEKEEPTEVVVVEQEASPPLVAEKEEEMEVDGKKEKDNSSESDTEYFANKECLNTNCIKKCLKFCKATPSILNYFYVKQKKCTQYVCRTCNITAVDGYINMTEKLYNHEPVLLADRPKKTDLVQLIDSSDEEEVVSNTATENEESSLDEETLLLINEELDTTIKAVFEKVNITKQIRDSENILKAKLKHVSDGQDELFNDFKELQRKADKIAQDFYACTKINFKHLPDLDCGTLYAENNNAAVPFVPPMGPAELETIQVGLSYYVQVKDAFSPWELSIVTNGEMNSCFYTVRYMNNGQSISRTIHKKFIAYKDAPEKRIETGTRILALYDPSVTQCISSTPASFMVGVVGEPAKAQNLNRYLIFFDTGYAQYIQHSNVRLVCGPSHNVWEDVHISNRDFIREYIQQYQIHRPMVRTTIGQKCNTRWDGKFYSSTVLDIDCSLIQMQCDRDQSKVEWLYRGSKRLEPVYASYRKEHLEKQQREYRNKMMQKQKFNTHPTTVQLLQSKKTTKLVPHQQHQQQQAAPAPPVKHLNNATIYLDDEPDKGKTVYLALKQENRPLKFEQHTCGPSCLKDINMKTLKYYSPLAKPLLCGWDRLIFKSKVKKFVVYKAPCGYSCRNMQAVHNFLRQTNSPLNVDNFEFSWELNCLAEYEDKSYQLKLDDISNGAEIMPVMCVNYYDNSLPPPCEYSATRIPTDGVNLNVDDDFLVGCDCDGDCSNRKTCSCWQLTLRGAKFFNQNPTEVGYHNKRLYESVSTGIYECNSRCKCSKQCLNRVVQHHLNLKLQVFKTSNRGWGIRCINDIPKGCFICVYAGNLLTEQTANEDGRDAGDEYYAELDYIEVVEKLKEGYESDEESMSQSDSGDEYNPTKDCDWQTTKRVQRNMRKPQAGTSQDRGKRQRRKKKFFDHQESNAASRKYKSIRKYYGKNEACYVMDAKITGNLGRYFNHSCDPNLYVQNVFVDTHDLRFPWVAFFSSRFIRAGTELTWNYNYEVGVVPGKVLYCECGAHNCRGRLL